MSTKFAPVDVRPRWLLGDDGKLFLAITLADPRVTVSDALWPQPILVEVPVQGISPELAAAWVAQYEAADASPEAEDHRKAMAFLGKLMGA
jgi:hypothetical protein